MSYYGKIILTAFTIFVLVLQTIAVMKEDDKYEKKLLSRDYRIMDVILFIGWIYVMVFH